MTRSLAKTTAKQPDSREPELSTFMDHLQELKGRFFWVAVYFVVASGVAYPFFQDIVHILLKPLGKQELYYMTPAGGLSFIIKVCMYVGVIAILPVIIYHLYKFVTPVMKRTTARAVAGYTTASTLLALAGIVFAYYLSLPAALNFLTNINLDQISSMLTIDSYMSFVIAYVLAGALLFQTPLIMLIVNSMTPLTPSKLMNYQRHMIVVSFILAAIISPTPDVVNQTILAAPMVAMYQIGVVAVWLRNHKRKQPLPALNTPRAEAINKPVVNEAVAVTTPQPVQPVKAQSSSGVSRSAIRTVPRPMTGRVYDIAPPKKPAIAATAAASPVLPRPPVRYMDVGPRRGVRQPVDRFANPLRREQTTSQKFAARRSVAAKGLIPTI